MCLSELSPNKCDVNVPYCVLMPKHSQKFSLCCASMFWCKQHWSEHDEILFRTNSFWHRPWKKIDGKRLNSSDFRAFVSFFLHPELLQRTHLHYWHEYIVYVYWLRELRIIKSKSLVMKRTGICAFITFTLKKRK